MGKVIVAGGGAAGMMAAAAAAQAGHQVTLFEKNEKLGKKIFITGKGRCNLTNACDAEELPAAVLSNPKFLYSAFHKFDNKNTMEFFEANGCRLKTERGNRVFPVSDHAYDVTDALKRRMDRLQVQVRLKSTVREIVCREENGEQYAAGVILAGGERREADAVIVATGGLAYPSTGSTGDGYRFAEQTGHGIVACRPSLVPLLTREKWCHELTGLSLKNVRVTLYGQKKEIWQGFGEMLFTHFGVSGPLILTASAYYVQKAWGEQARMEIDLKPALSDLQLEERLLREMEENRSRQFRNAVTRLFPSRLVPVMVALSGIDPDKKAGEITKEERRKFADLIRRLPLTVTGCRDYPEAVITKGGVSVKDINPSTMESKKVKGLYFAGEVLDLDAVTGGFNLQIAWSTGYLAGSSIA